MAMRVLKTFLAAFILCAPFPAFAQQQTPARIGMLRTTAPPAENLAAFRQGMRERGHVEGKTYVLIPGWLKPGEKRVKNRVLAKRLVAKGVDVIVTAGPIVREAKRIAPSTPIVMAASSDPVASRLINSLAAPGGNITGMSAAASEMTVKGIEVLKQIAPHIRKIGAFHRKRANRKRARSPRYRAIDEGIEKALGVKIIGFKMGRNDDFDALFKNAAAQGVDAISFRSGSRYTKAQRRKMALAAQRAKLPNVSSLDAMVKVGGLLSVGTSRPWLFRRTAAYVALILKGVKPSTLPVEQPTRFYVTINLKTAKALGITVPPALLLRADEVIE